MLSLLYISRSRLPEGARGDRDLAEILDAAASRNLKNGITGALLHTGPEFAQVLEGPESAVVNIMGSILLDPRHDHVRIISRENVEQRSFPNWGMALVGHHPDIKATLDMIWTAPDDRTLQDAVRVLVDWMKSGASAQI